MGAARNQSPYRFDADGSFVVADYNRAPPFASFLPGIAGPWGIPLWVFYVNRGQGVCSFGVRDKDHPLAEFLSANWAYQLVFRQGFQTFMKIRRDKAWIHYEPFQMTGANDPEVEQVLRIFPWEIRLLERNRRLGLDVDVRYFTLPGEPLGALVRTVTVRNASDRTLAAQILDGLALIIPHGLNNYALKNMRYITQSHVEVTGLAERIPGFRTKATTEDSVVVGEVRAVNFCFGFEDRFPHELLRPLVDPAAVFGPTTDLNHPEIFCQPGEFRPPARQMTENHLPSAFLLAGLDIAPGAQATFHSLYGHAPRPEALVRFVRRARSPGYVEAKSVENRRLIERITQPCATASSHEAFNGYARQNLLDNVLRGGVPTTLRDSERPVVLSLFARKHGDLERDYNYFAVEPTYFSQGESNYRDVNQNRRHDVFMNPDVEADTIRLFVNLIQPDGFNPLLVRPIKYLCRDGPGLRRFLKRCAGSAARLLRSHVTRPFELGHLLRSLEEERINLHLPREEFVSGLLVFAEGLEDASHGMGYWTDHWFYNLDLLESFRGIYPERYADLLFRRKEFVYADSHVFVKPRAEKYVLCNGQPMQIDSLLADPAKQALIESRRIRPYAVRTRHGRGRIYETFLAPKLLVLAGVKLASLDSHGMGIEMEADRPNWYDALNGLPGQFGSSLSETLELKRLLLVLREALDLTPRNFRWTLPVEAATLLRGLNRLLAAPPAAGPRPSAFAFWDKASTLKERFRDRVRQGFDGAETTLSGAEVRRFVSRALVKVEAGLRAGRDRRTGLCHTYFRYEVPRFRTTHPVGSHMGVQPLAFRQVRLPLFLEGQVHLLRLERDATRARRIVRAVKQSDLFDRVVNMYKVNACLDRETKDIGRARTFPRGWLENESIWLHMEYKFLLEMLRSGLHPEFFEDLRHCAIPFLRPEVYGRSTLENSSFLVSSAYPDASMVGRGFMARLSGATAEFVHMWIVLCAGERLFRQGPDGQLEAVLEPALPGWLFTARPSSLRLVNHDGTESAHEVPPRSFAFVLLGRIPVIYTQDGPPRDTFGPNAARIRSLRLVYHNGIEADLIGATIPSPHAEALRRREIRLVTARLA